MPLSYFKFWADIRPNHDITFAINDLYWLHHNMKVDYIRRTLPSLSTFKCVFEYLLPHDLCESKIVTDRRGDLLKFIAVRHYSGFMYDGPWLVDLYKSFVRVGIEDWFRSVNYTVDIDYLRIKDYTNINDIKTYMKYPGVRAEEILKEYGCILRLDVIDYLTGIVSKIDPKKYNWLKFDEWNLDKLKLLLERGFMSKDDARKILNRELHVDL